MSYTLARYIAPLDDTRWPAWPWPSRLLPRYYVHLLCMYLCYPGISFMAPASCSTSMARFPCTSEPLLTWLPLHLVEVKAWRPTGLPWHGLIGALQTVVLLPLLSGIAPRTTLSLSASLALWRLMSKG
ncbi:hypothetical protein LZ32DRAFT_112297 [Colletotrichum eremochloae]|nr:hypothetical protein LZ32DRAFT_112297 [Colletotrichum eremochloae]